MTITRRTTLAAAGALLAAPALRAQPQTTLKLGHSWPAAEIHARASQLFAEEVARRTNNALKVEVFGNNALGQDREMITATRLGTLDVWVGGAGVLTAGSRSAGIYTIPFMLDGFEHFRRVYGGQIGDELNRAILAESRWQVLGYWLRGPRWLTVKRPVRTPADLAGMKIRVPDSPVFVKSFQRLGAAPTPMAFGEVFTALQQGVIDGQENPLSLILAARFHEVVRYLVRTEHILEPIAVVMAGQRLGALPPAHREALVAAAAGEARQMVDDEVIAGEASFVGQLQAAGMTLIEPDKAAFRARLEGFVQAEFPELDPLFQRIRAVAG